MIPIIRNPNESGRICSGLVTPGFVFRNSIKIVYRIADMDAHRHVATLYSVNIFGRGNDVVTPGSIDIRFVIPSHGSVYPSLYILKHRARPGFISSMLSYWLPAEALQLPVFPLGGEEYTKGLLLVGTSSGTPKYSSST